MTRLRWKLLAAMVALVAVTIGLSAVFARRVTHDQVHRLLITRAPLRFDDVARALGDHLRATGGWSGVDAVIDRLTDELPSRLILASMDGDVIAVSRDLRTAEISVGGEDRVTITTTARGPREQLRIEVPPTRILDAAGNPVARVYAMPADDAGETTAEREIAAVDRRLILLFAIATLVALILTAVISRRITRPIEQLTVAVQQMGRGSVPVPVRVDGRDEIARLATSFNAMADAVAKEQALRRRMTGDVAHELRTPLTNLRCELEAIQDGLVSPDAARVGSLHEEVLHLQRLVEDLQELALADAGALRLDKERVDLGAVVARIVGAQADVTADDGIVVDADVTRLRQVMQNLLSNALKHTPAGGRIRVRVARDGCDATVAVADDGPGIPAGDLERVFERFYRVDQARGRDRGGTGLGLAIVRRIVELHGGRVWADSVAGRGATVTFTIPRASS
ncbi:MAG: HAMP domain-containing protein [Deltaproteobacteria bacterium]|nr:MAG: HAMP domain-containing protein [Deltaproteobacteria bacterium]